MYPILATATDLVTEATNAITSLGGNASALLILAFTLISVPFAVFAIAKRATRKG